MQFLDQKDQLLKLQLLDKNIEKCQLLDKNIEKCQLLDKNIEKCQLLEFKKVEKSGTCTAVWLKNRVS